MSYVGLLKVLFCLQVTGGGGYTKENVARCWTVETGVLLDTELPNGMLRHLSLIEIAIFSQPTAIWDL